MTKRTIVEEHLVDDIDGTVAVGTYTFAVDGVHYEIELSKRNATALERALQPYIVNGRKVRGQKKAKSSISAAGTASERAMELARVRAWANQNGYDVSDRGRVPVHVMEAYAASQ